MGASNTIHIKDIGTVVFARRKRTRRLILALQPSGVLRVTVPYGVSYKEAEKVLSSNIKWVRRYLSRMKKAEGKHLALMRDAEEVGADDAARRLTSRLEDLASRHRFSYKKLFIKSQKTRWGSCSPDNNISLNVNLARLPEELIDYVLLHELLHTKVKNHGQLFWQGLDGILPGAKELDARLRGYRLGLL